MTLIGRRIFWRLRDCPCCTTVGYNRAATRVARRRVKRQERRQWQREQGQ